MATYAQSKHTEESTAGTPLALHSSWYVSAMEHLIEVVQELSHARDIDTIARIVRDAARELTGADGATVVLRDGEFCHYIDENAIGPLWKGQRFPMSICVSGWVMLHAKPVMIEDIYKDDRIPAGAYQPTFVQSLAMVPIRRRSPIGAIGNYWASHHEVTEEEIAILQALADTTSVALENVQLYEELEARVQNLQESNYELSRFAWVASHDLQEPLRTIVTQVELLQRRLGNQLDTKSEGYIRSATQGATRLQHLVDELLVHARAEKVENFKPLALSAVVEEVFSGLGVLIRESHARIECGELPWVWGNRELLGRLLQNLITNGIKFQKAGNQPRLRIAAERVGDMWRVSVADNGIGVEPDYCERIFGLFQRLHSQDMYAGSGIGLATAKKIVALHDGEIWMESVPGTGSTVYFTLPVADHITHTLNRGTE